jgi:hypothetical protein
VEFPYARLFAAELGRSQKRPRLEELITLRATP